MKSYVVDYVAKDIKYNKKKYFWLFIGIILATILLTSTYLLIYNINLKDVEDLKNTNGNYYFSFINTNMKVIDKLKDDENVDDSSISIVNFQTENSFKEISNLKVDIVSMDDNTLNNMYYLKLKEGRMPQNSDEIVIEEWISRRNIGCAKIGDTLSTMINGEKKVYRVVGYYENFATSQYTQKVNFYTYSKNGEAYNSGEKCITNIYFRLKEGVSIKDKFSVYRNMVKDGEFEANDSLLYKMGEHENSPSNNFNLKNLFFILPISIISIIMIYNCISINLVDRMKQLRLLRKIGAASRDIKNILLCETLCVYAISAPIGIIISIMILKIGLPLLNSSHILSTTMHVQFIDIIKSLIIVLLTCLFTTYIVGKGIVKSKFITENINDISLMDKKTASKKKHNLSNIEFEFARRNIKRNKKRYKLTVLSVTISIILFVVSISLFSMFNSLLTVAGEEQKLDYSIYKGDKSPQQEFENEYEQIKNVDEVKAVFKKFNPIFGSAIVTEDELNEKFREFINKEYNDGTTEINTLFDVYDEDRLRNSNIESYLMEGSIDIDKMINDGEVLIVQKNNVKKEDERYKGNTTNFKVGDTIKVKLNKNSNKVLQLKVGGIISARPYNTLNKYDKELNKKVKDFNSELKIVISDKLVDKYTNLIGYDVMLKDYSYRKDAGRQLIDINNSVQDSKIIEMEDCLAKKKETMNELKIIIYAVIVLACSIGILNLFNTCRSNVLMRQREISMLKALGVTNKQISKIINYEGIIFGVKGSIRGSIISVIFLYFIYYFIKSKEFFKWDMNYGVVIIAIILSIIIGYLATILPLRKVNRANIIEMIKIDC